ncbi:hypothetical protein BD410DRAFT_792623, partial [Rickenella mellea]
MARTSFDDVLGTNYVPTDNERRFLATWIDAKERELSSLNGIIAPLLAKHDKLHDRTQGSSHSRPTSHSRNPQ